MDNNFLIPANTKRSMLLFGLFNTFDLIMFGSGLFVSLLLLVILDLSSLPLAIIAISPGLITTFLVIPIPNYHNIFSVIVSAYTFYTTRQKFIWKGWCFLNEQEEDKK